MHPTAARKQTKERTTSQWAGRGFQTPKSNTTGTMTCVAFQLPSEKTKWLVRYAILRLYMALGHNKILTP